MLMFEDLFSDSSHYGDVGEELKCFTTESGKLDVTLDMIPDPGEDTQYKPSVNIGFGDMQFEKSVVNYEANPSDDLASRNFVAPTSVPFVIRHIMPSSDGAYQLGHISLDAVFGLKEWIRGQLGLRGFSISQLARPKPLGKSPHPYYSVDLSCLLEFEYTMTSSIQGHRLKKVIMEDLFSNSSVDS
jgi:hypothetical protein